MLPPPLKVDGGYIFTPVCEHDISKSYGRIRTKLGGQVKLGVWQWIIDSILVKIRIWILESFNYLRHWRWMEVMLFKVILHHWEMGPKTIYSMMFQKSWRLIMTKLGEWVRLVTRTSRLDFEGPDADPAYQWDTKCKLFSLAVVCALPSADLVWGCFNMHIEHIMHIVLPSFTSAEYLWDLFM